MPHHFQILHPKFNFYCYLLLLLSSKYLHYTRCKVKHKLLLVYGWCHTIDNNSDKNLERSRQHSSKTVSFQKQIYLGQMVLKQVLSNFTTTEENKMDLDINRNGIYLLGQHQTYFASSFHHLQVVLLHQVPTKKVATCSASSYICQHQRGPQISIGIAQDISIRSITRTLYTTWHKKAWQRNCWLAKGFYQVQPQAGLESFLTVHQMERN